MNGRAFLDVAREQAAGTTEAHWRAAAGRAYYALLHEGRQALAGWGHPLPPRENLHSWVRLRFVYATHADLKSIGRDLERLAKLRNEADYQLTQPGNFAFSSTVVQAVGRAQAAVDLLDQIDADPARRTAAAAAVRP